MSLRATLTALAVFVLCQAGWAGEVSADFLTFVHAQLKFNKGLALDVGCGDGRVMTALAQKTSLNFSGIESDEKAAAQARATIDASGLYGVRANAGSCAFNPLPFPDNCATLVIFGDECVEGLRGRSLKEVYRVLSPNGVALIGQRKGTLARTQLESWLREAQITSYQILTEQGVWARVTKAGEKGWDEWTHRAHDAGNTFASNDTTISGQAFKPKWYTRAVPGLSSADVAVVNGRIIFSGMGYASAPQTTPFIQVLDAFSGVELWSKAGIQELPIDRPMGTYSNRENSQDMVVVGDSLYLLGSKLCHLINLSTGAIEKSLAVPADAKPAADDIWLYISTDGETLYGAAGKSPHVFVDWNTMFYRGIASSVFAIDLKSGSCKWSVTERIWTSSIAVGAGKLHFCDEKLQLHAVDLKTGAPKWQTDTKYPAKTAVAGGACYNDKYYVLYNAAADAAKPKSADEEENKEPAKKPGAQDPSSILLTQGHNRRKLDAYASTDGKLLYPCDFGKNNVANVSFSGNTIYGAAQHSNGLAAVDANTGVFRWNKQVTTKCSPTIASPNCIFMRAHLVTRVFDLSTLQITPRNDISSVTFGGFRPTCSFPAVPAYGTLYIQAEGCNCSSAIRGNLAMMQGKASEPSKEPALVKGPAYGAPPGPDTPSTWATWRADVGRSGATEEALDAPLKPKWSLKLKGDLTPLAVSKDTVFCGSDAHKLYAVDLNTGKARWQYVAAGRLEVAPYCSRGRVYFSDDAGWAYCLVAESGELVWKFRAAPADEHIIMEEAFCSRWPSGSGVIVDNGLAYFTAGYFPAQNSYVYAVDAVSGEMKWSNTYSGSPTEPTGLVAHGPMALSGEKLYFTTGFGAPWCVNLKDPAHKAESFEGSTTAALKKTNGVMPVGSKLFYSVPELEIVHHAQYKKTSSLRPLPILGEDRLFRLTPCLVALKTTEEATLKPPATPIQTIWSAWKNQPMTALVRAKNTLFSGGKDRVFATSIDGKELWSEAIAGTVRDLAVASGRLLVLTDESELMCFGQ